MKQYTARFRQGIYRSRNGIVFGVCRGFAESLDISVFWTRMVCAGAFLISGFWPMAGIYILASLLMKPRPVSPLTSDDEKDFYDRYVHSRKSAIRSLKERFSRLEARIRRLEDTVTAREFDWDRRFYSK